MASSFQVKNNGHRKIFVNLEHPSIAVEVPPGKTSTPFTRKGEYKIRAERTTLPIPPPEVIVVFSPGGTIEAKAVNKPAVDIDIIAKFDFKG